MAGVFKSGNSQAVRLPGDSRFDVADVEIVRRRHHMVLTPPRRIGLDVYRALAAIDLRDDLPDSIPDQPADRGRAPLRR